MARKIKYPSTIKKVMYTLEELSLDDIYTRAITVLEKTALHKDTLFLPQRISSVAVSFTIILSDGSAFTGFAFKKANDGDDISLAYLIAAARACAVLRSILERYDDNQVDTGLVRALYIGSLAEIERRKADLNFSERIKKLEDRVEGIETVKSEVLHIPTQDEVLKWK